MLVRYHDTSVGPYSELMFSTGLYRLGGHFGFHISQIYVDSQRSIDGGRANWAVPKKLAIFEWQETANQIQVKVRMAEASQPFLTTSFTRSSVHIPASTALVPPQLKTILQVQDPDVPGTYLATNIHAAGKLHLLTEAKVASDGQEVPKDNGLGIWRTGISLMGFQGSFAEAQTVLGQQSKAL